MVFLNLFAVTIVLLVFAFFTMVVLRITSVDQTSRDVMLLLVGALSGSLSTVVGYFFGSSKGSADKNVAIGKMVEREHEQHQSFSG